MEQNEAVLVAELGVGEGYFDRGIIIEIPEDYYLVIYQDGEFLEPIFEAEIPLDAEHIPGLREEGNDIDCRLFYIRVDLGLEAYYFEKVDVNFAENLAINVDFDMADSFIGIADYKKLLTHLMENMPTPEDGVWCTESNIYSTILQTVQIFLNETLSEEIFIDPECGELLLDTEEEKEAFERYLEDMSSAANDILFELGFTPEIHITNLETDPNFEKILDADYSNEDEEDDEDLDIKFSWDEEEEEEDEDEVIDNFDLEDAINDVYFGDDEEDDTVDEDDEYLN